MKRRQSTVVERLASYIKGVRITIYGMYLRSVLDHKHAKPLSERTERNRFLRANYLEIKLTNV